jgi:hypothetical protein
MHEGGEIMADIINVASDILAEAIVLSGCLASPARAVGVQANLELLAGRLRGGALAAFAGPFETERLRAGVAAARGALEIETAIRALADAQKQRGHAAELLQHLAYAQCLAALGPLAREIAPVGDVAANALAQAGAAAQVRGVVPGVTPGAAADIDVLKEISHVHRQHARYHTLHKYDNAREIAHESHKLKTLADLWLAGGGPAPRADVDFADPRYRSAPCSDLNVPAAIPHIGFLFLEGAGKPPELTILQDRLGALAAEIGAFGSHLLRAMDAAWMRESALFAPDRIAIAWTRLLVVLRNWRAAHDSELAGRLLALCHDELSILDLTPQAVRADMRQTGAKLSAIGWVLDIAAQLCATAGFTLADNNWRYTQYSDFLEAV